MKRSISTSILVALALLVALTSRAAVADTLTIATKLLESPMRVTVIVPDSAKDKTRQFPTVYLLNGYGGGYRDWGKSQPRLHQLADQYGMVLVMPDGRDSWYWDSPEHPEMQMESFFVKDLVPAIDAQLPTIDDPSKRAILGLSMGGHGALWLAMRHPDVWGNAGSMSGGVDIRPFDQRWKMKHWLGERSEHPDRWDNYTVMSLVPTLKPGTLNLIIDCGTDDFFYDVNVALHEALLKQGIKHDFISRPGNHSWPYWRNSVLYHLLFFNEAFTK